MLCMTTSISLPTASKAGALTPPFVYAKAEEGGEEGAKEEEGEEEEEEVEVEGKRNGLFKNSQN